MSRFENLTESQIESAFKFIFYTESRLREISSLLYMLCYVRNIQFTSGENLERFIHIIIDYYCKRKFSVRAFVQSHMIVFKFTFKK